MDAVAKSGRSGWSAKQIAMIGLMAGVLCVLAPWSVPLPGLVPVSLGSLGVIFSVYILGMKRGTLSVLIYLLLGFAGLPVFTGFAGGPAKVLGPTGGYLAGYLFLALICGFFVDRWPLRPAMHFAGMVLGTAVLYLFGTVWYAYLSGLTLAAAMTAAVLPFLPGDLLKIAVVLIVGGQIRTRIRKAGL